MKKKTIVQFSQIEHGFMNFLFFRISHCVQFINTLLAKARLGKAIITLAICRDGCYIRFISQWFQISVRLRHTWSERNKYAWNRKGPGSNLTGLVFFKLEISRFKKMSASYLSA